MKIALIAHTITFPWEIGNNRFHYIASELAKTHEVEVVTSSFCHFLKQQRTQGEKQLDSLPYGVKFIPEPGYSDNVSIKRVFSHRKFTLALKRFLKGRSYDLVYTAYPLMSSAKAVLGSSNCPVILDVQDNWPESFKVIPLLNLAMFRPVFHLYRKRAAAIFSSANACVAVSQTYADYIKGLSGSEALVVYIGGEFSDCTHVEKPDDEFWCIYCGTISVNYDLAAMLSNLPALPSNIRIKIFGKGPAFEAVSSLASQHQNVDMMGSVEYSSLVGYLKKSDLALNPISTSSTISLTNKLGDYFGIGLPIVSSQSNLEVKRLIDGAGINVTVEQFGNAIGELYENPTMLQILRDKSASIGREGFHRETAYLPIFELIESLLSTGGMS